MEAHTIANPFAHIDARLRAIEAIVANIANRDLPQPEKRYYSIQEASKKLLVAPITLYRGIKTGRVPFKKVGSRLMIPGSFVDRT